MTASYANQDSTIGGVLSHLLAPLPLDTFFRDYYERRPFHSNGKQPTPWDIDGLYRIIRALAESLPGRIRANNNGRVLRPGRFLSAAQIYEWALHEHEAGATLIVSRIEDVDMASRIFASELGKTLDAQVELYAFLTPAGAQGFPPHFDTEDVFAIQVVGEKEWHLGGYALELPTPRQGCPVDWPDNAPAEARIRMDPGSTLYLPRGYVHWAHTTAEVSLHITAGIRTLTMGELIKFATKRLYDKIGFHNSFNEELFLAQSSMEGHPDCFRVRDIMRRLEVGSDLIVPAQEERRSNREL